MPPLMSNHGNFIVSLGSVCRWLATKAEALGVEIYPGFAGAEILTDERGPRDRRRHRRHGRDASRRAGTGLPARHGAHGQIRADRRGRARLARQGPDPPLRASTRGASRGKFGIGLKELWEVEPAQHRPGLVQHSFGWPLGMTHRRRLVPLSLRREPRLRRLRRPPELREPVSLAVRGVPALQDARGDPRHVRGRAAHLLRRARHHRGRLAERAAARLSRRRADRLRGRLRQRAAHQGQPQRHAVRHARGRARRRGARRRAARTTRSRATRRPGAARRSARDLKRGAQRQAALVALRHARRRGARRPRHVDEPAPRLLALRHARPRQVGRREPEAGGRVQADRLSEARRRAHLRPALLGVPVEHQPRGGPAGASARRRPGRSRRRASTTSSPDLRRAIARPASTNGWRRAASRAS